MARTDTYKQCLLKREEDRLGVYTMVSWIPADLAVVGRNVQIKDEDGEWGHVWRVESTSARSVEKSDFKTYEQLVRGHRQATGDSTKRSEVDGTVSRHFSK